MQPTYWKPASMSVGWKLKFLLYVNIKMLFSLIWLNKRIFKPAVQCYGGRWSWCTKRKKLLLCIGSPRTQYCNRPTVLRALLSTPRKWTGQFTACINSSTWRTSLQGIQTKRVPITYTCVFAQFGPDWFHFRKMQEFVAAKNPITIQTIVCTAYTLIGKRVTCVYVEFPQDACSRNAELRYITVKADRHLF